jgi:hypothetical protein
MAQKGSWTAMSRGPANGGYDVRTPGARSPKREWLVTAHLARCRPACRRSPDWTERGRSARGSRTGLHAPQRSFVSAHESARPMPISNLLGGAEDRPSWMVFTFLPRRDRPDVYIGARFSIPSPVAVHRTTPGAQAMNVVVYCALATLVTGCGRCR